MHKSLNAQIKTKKTHLGELPLDWEVVKLGSIARISSGGTPDRNKSEYWNGSIPWITTGLINYKPIAEAEEFITTLGLQNSSAKLLPTGTLLIAMYGQGATRGRAAILVIEAAINQACASITPTPLASVWYIYYLLQHNYHRIREFSQGGNQENLNANLLKQFPIPLPPLPEQKKIAEILGTWDSAIEKMEALIREKEQIKKGLMQQLLTGKRRLRGFKAKWSYVKADHLFQRKSVRSTGDEPILSVTQDNGIVIREEVGKRIQYDKDNTDNYKLVEPNDFVISLRSFQGGLEICTITGRVSPAYHVIQAIQPLSHEFYRHYFKSYEFINRLDIAVIGIRDGKQVSYDDFCFMRLPYPELKEQEAIADTINASDDEMKLMRRSLDAVRDQKKGLMQKLLTGKIRITHLINEEVPA